MLIRLSRALEISDKYQRIVLEIEHRPCTDEKIINHRFINIFDSWCRHHTQYQKGSPKGGPFLFVPFFFEYPHQTPCSRQKTAAFPLSVLVQLLQRLISIKLPAAMRHSLFSGSP